MILLPTQRLTAAKIRRSNGGEGKEDDEEGNTYCELALMPKRSTSYKALMCGDSSDTFEFCMLRKYCLQKEQLDLTMAWTIS